MCGDSMDMLWLNGDEMASRIYSIVAQIVDAWDVAAHIDVMLKIGVAVAHSGDVLVHIGDVVTH